MNGKMFIVVLAVCLVSAHAFVKRDTAAADNDITKNIKELSENLNKEITKALKPENIQKGFNNIIDNLQKSLAELKEKANAKQ